MQETQAKSTSTHCPYLSFSAKKDAPLEQCTYIRYDMCEIGSDTDLEVFSATRPNHAATAREDTPSQYANTRPEPTGSSLFLSLASSSSASGQSSPNLKNSGAMMTRNGQESQHLYLLAVSHSRLWRTSMLLLMASTSLYYP